MKIRRTWHTQARIQKVVFSNIAYYQLHLKQLKNKFTYVLFNCEPIFFSEKSNQAAWYAQKKVTLFQADDFWIDQQQQQLYRYAQLQNTKMYKRTHYTNDHTVIACDVKNLTNRQHTHSHQRLCTQQRHAKELILIRTNEKAICHRHHLCHTQAKGYWKYRYVCFEHSRIKLCVSVCATHSSVMVNSVKQIWLWHFQSVTKTTNRMNCVVDFQMFQIHIALIYAQFHLDFIGRGRAKVECPIWV